MTGGARLPAQGSHDRAPLISPREIGHGVQVPQANEPRQEET
jgi:hypothetical protein